jgi:hypothetical protein
MYMNVMPWMEAATFVIYKHLSMSRARREKSGGLEVGENGFWSDCEVTNLRRKATVY